MRVSLSGEVGRSPRGCFPTDRLLPWGGRWGRAPPSMQPAASGQQPRGARGTGDASLLRSRPVRGPCRARGDTWPRVFCVGSWAVLGDDFLSLGQNVTQYRPRGNSRNAPPPPSTLAPYAQVPGVGTVTALRPLSCPGESWGVTHKFERRSSWSGAHSWSLRPAGVQASASSGIRREDALAGVAVAVCPPIFVATTRELGPEAHTRTCTSSSQR